MHIYIDYILYHIVLYFPHDNPLLAKSSGFVRPVRPQRAKKVQRLGLYRWNVPAPTTTGDVPGCWKSRPVRHLATASARKPPSGCPVMYRRYAEYFPWPLIKGFTDWANSWRPHWPRAISSIPPHLAFPSYKLFGPGSSYAIGRKWWLMVFNFPRPPQRFPKNITFLRVIPTLTLICRSFWHIICKKNIRLY